MTDWGAAMDQPAITSVRAGAFELVKGGRVRLRPRGRADIFDLAFADKTAVIESIEEDFEGKVYLAVVLDDDPGRDLGQLRQVGHRFFFGVDEVEPIDANPAP